MLLQHNMLYIPAGNCTHAALNNECLTYHASLYIVGILFKNVPNIIIFELLRFIHLGNVCLKVNRD